MKKRFTIVLTCFLLFALCFTACGDSGDDAPDGMQTVSDPSVVDYSFYVPITWAADLGSGVVSAYHSKSDASSVTMNQWNLTDGITSVETWWEQYVPVFESSFRDFILESEEECLLGGVNARKYVYTGKLYTGNGDSEDGMTTFRFMQVATIRRGMVYVFTYTSTADVYESNLTDVESMLSAFKFN